MNKITGLGGCVLGTSTSAVGTAIQTNEVLQTVSLIITIIGSIVTTVSAIYFWWKRASADGKITKDEIDEGVEIIQHGIDNIKDEVDENKKKGE